MCEILTVKGQRCVNIGEIRSALGGFPVMDEGYGETADNSCLCSVDIEATAKRYGLMLVPDDEPITYPPRLESPLLGSDKHG